MNRPKAIEIFLPDGDPLGIRQAGIKGRTIQVTVVPQTLLDRFRKMPESDKVAIYFLLGEDEEGQPQVYIGQTGNLKSRLASHAKEKTFWERVIVAYSLTDSLTNTHALFLEWCCIQKCYAAGRYHSQNGNSGSKPHVLVPQEAECQEYFEELHTLLATLGYPLFDPVINPTPIEEAPSIVPSLSTEELVNPERTTGTKEVFYCTVAGVQGQGVYTSEGFVVLKGSIGRTKNLPSLDKKATKKSRDRFMASSSIRIDGDKYVFLKDELFQSPTYAARTLTGGSVKGPGVWTNKDGKTYRELMGDE